MQTFASLERLGPLLGQREQQLALASQQLRAGFEPSRVVAAAAGARPLGHVAQQQLATPITSAPCAIAAERKSGSTAGRVCCSFAPRESAMRSSTTIMWWSDGATWIWPARSGSPSTPCDAVSADPDSSSRGSTLGCSPTVEDDEDRRGELLRQRRRDLQQRLDAAERSADDDEPCHGSGRHSACPRPNAGRSLAAPRRSRPLARAGAGAACRCRRSRSRRCGGTSADRSRRRRSCGGS